MDHVLSQKMWNNFCAKFSSTTRWKLVHFPGDLNFTKKHVLLIVEKNCNNRLKTLTVVSNVSALAWFICSIKLRQWLLGICFGAIKKKIYFSCVVFFCRFCFKKEFFFYILFNRKSHDQYYILVWLISSYASDRNSECC